MTDLLSGLTPKKVELINKSGVLEDPAKVADLERILPEDRQRVLLQYVSLEMPWIEAIAGATAVSDASDNDEAHETTDRARLIQRRRVDSLIPNKLNQKLFGKSLGSERIEALAVNIRTHGLRTPIEILADGCILDGHCRYLAVQHLGWEMTDIVIVADTMSEQQMLRYIVDAVTSQRIMSVREQVMVFQAQLELAKLDPQNEDPEDSSDSDPHFEDRPDAKHIRDAAARRAGFRSYETARRARLVFEDGDEETQQMLDNNELSVNAAHNRVKPKRSKSTDSDQCEPKGSETGGENAQHDEGSEEANKSEEEPCDVEDAVPDADTEHELTRDESEHAEEAALSARDAVYSLAEDLAVAFQQLAAEDPGTVYEDLKAVMTRIHKAVKAGKAT